MKYYDLHTHSLHSDGHATIGELLEIAAEKGYGLGVSDHLYCGGMDTEKEVLAYLEDLKNYPVLKGCEANIGEDYSRSGQIISSFDYVIASVHDIEISPGRFEHLGKYFGQRAHENNCTWNNPFCMEQSEAYLTALLPRIEHTMRSQRMDIYGHCTVLPFCEHLAGTAFLTDWEQELISLCLKYDIAMEISGLWKEPQLAMVRLAKAAGVRFTFGSDCHLKKDICDIGYSISLAQKAGLAEDDFKHW